MPANPYKLPQDYVAVRPVSKTRGWFGPALWSLGAVACSIAYFGIVIYLMDIGLTSKPDTKFGLAIYWMVDASFLPFGFFGAVFCLIALIVDVRRKSWIWFAVVLFFSFFSFAHLSMIVSN